MYSFQRFVFAFFDLIATTFSNWLFVITQRGAARRKWLLILLGAFLWAFLAWKKHPPILGMELFRNFIEYPFVTLFAADVFRHVLIAGSVFWLAYRIAAIYLDDIFELNETNNTLSMIWTAIEDVHLEVVELYSTQIHPFVIAAMFLVLRG